MADPQKLTPQELTLSRELTLPRELTLEELRDRIRAAGVTIAEHRLTMVRKLLADALAPVRVLDSRTIKTVEPAVTFTPTREVGNER